MDLQAPNLTGQPIPGTPSPETPARPLSASELEELAERIIERMKKELRLDMQREGKRP